MSKSILTVDVDALINRLERDMAVNQAAARPAAQAGAQVFYEAVKANVAAIKAYTGRLRSSIYQAYSKDNSGRGLATYHISWNANKLKAPHGHFIEFGFLQRYEITYDKVTQRFTTHKDRPLPEPRHVPAKAFVRGAMVHQEAAYAAMMRVYLQRLKDGGVIA